MPFEYAMGKSEEGLPPCCLGIDLAKAKAKDRTQAEAQSWPRHGDEHDGRGRAHHHCRLQLVDRRRNAPGKTAAG